MPDAAPASSVSRRWPVIAAGAIALAAAIAASSAWWSFVAREGNPGGWGMLPAIATAALLVVAIVNARRAKRKAAPLLTNGETLGAFLIVLAGGWTATWAYVEVMMPLLTSPAVFGSPENGWVEHLLPHLPAWALGPMAEPYASGYYNGMATGTPMPWRLWLLPVLIWSSVGALLTLFGIAVAGLIARPWIHHDRLTFPHAEVLLGALRGWPGKPLFWWGVAIASAVPLWNLLQGFVPVFPKASWYFGGDANGVVWAQGLQKFQTDLKLDLFGLFYFVHRDIVISMVLLFPLVALRDYGLSLGGVTLPHADLLSGGGGAGGLLTQGGLLALVGAALWSGRHAIGEYLKAARAGTSDGWSWLSPRATVIILGVSLGAFALWLGMLGLHRPGTTLAFLLAQTAGWIGTARVAVESAVQVDWAVDPADLSVIASGTRVVGPAGLVALALAACWIYGGGGISQLNNALMTERLRSQEALPKGLLPAILLSVVCATAAAMLGTAWLAYGRGASTFPGDWHYQWYMRIPYDRAVEQMRNPTETDWLRLGWLGGGALIMGALIWLRNHVIGWFIHPIGLILASEGGAPGSNAHMWVFTGAAAWLTKTLVLRLGGVESYEKWKPFFGGLVLGGFLPAMLKLAIGTVYTLTKGHALGAM